MSVYFTARVIYGFHIQIDEFNALKERIDEDEVYMTDNSYDEKTDMFFIVKDICETDDWEEIDSLNVVVLPEIVSKIEKFQELFPNRAEESPKYYLIEEVW